MCDERERLIGFVYDECDADERRHIETHLESCPVCRAEIGGLRRVREDLLAWRVPEHTPVWRPAPAEAAAPVWRRSPGWGLAAAAAVVLMAGLAGGAATRVLMPPPAAPASVTAADLNAIEQQILTLMRAELARVSAARSEQTAAVPQAPPPPQVVVDAQQVERRILDKLEQSDRETLNYLIGMHNMLVRNKDQADRDINRFRRELEEIRVAIDLKGGGQ
jgi:hypothetical protein